MCVCARGVGGGDETTNSREEKILWSLTAITVGSYMKLQFIVHNQLFYYKNRQTSVSGPKLVVEAVEAGAVRHAGM